MSKTEILKELPQLTAADLAEVQAKLDELAGESWQDRGELTDADKSTLDAALAGYAMSPTSGSTWDDVKVRVRGKLGS